MAKYTYIKNDISGYYIEFSEMFDENLYNNLGSTWEDFLSGNWVLLSDEQVAFHNENPTASIKEVWDMEITPPQPRTLEDAKNEMLAKIENYDNSDQVNGFTVNGFINGWFTAAERNNYRTSIDAAELLEIETLSFFVGETLLEVPTSLAKQMLAQLQLYADKCFIVTKEHKIAVEAMETIEEVDGFNWREGYPSKINFEIPIGE